MCQNTLKLSMFELRFAMLVTGLLLQSGQWLNDEDGQSPIGIWEHQNSISFVEHELVEIATAIVHNKS